MQGKKRKSHDQIFDRNRKHIWQNLGPILGKTNKQTYKKKNPNSNKTTKSHNSKQRNLDKLGMEGNFLTW